MSQQSNPLPNYTFEVFGNYGVILVSASTGSIVKLDEADFDADEDGNYRDIQRFDVSEWQETYPERELAEAHVDILDIGFWYADPPVYAHPACNRDFER